MRIETRKKLALGSKVKEEENLERYGGFREDIGMDTYLHGPMDYAKTLKLRFRVGGRNVPQRRKRYASSREEEEHAQMRPCGKAVKSRADTVREYEIYKEGRDVVWGEMRKIDECGMEEFGTLCG